MLIYFVHAFVEELVVGVRRGGNRSSRSVSRWDPAGSNIVVRLFMVTAGLGLNGVGIAALVQSGMGLGAWDVLHQGIARHTGLSFGVVVILVTVVALIPWWPLRERPHIGTILNVFIAGLVIDWLLAGTGPAHAVWLRLVLMVAGVAIFALGQGMYLAPRLGAGAREGLMTGIHRRFGISIRLARFLLEGGVLIVGILLGGSVGIGTLFFTVAIGPLVQAAMRLFRYRDPQRADEPVSGSDGHLRNGLGTGDQPAAPPHQPVRRGVGDRAAEPVDP